MKAFTTRQIALNGLAAGLYAAVTILTASFAYGNIQFRLAEALCLLAALEPGLTVGLTLGCLIANIFSTVSALDIIVSTLATFLSCLLLRHIKKSVLLPLPLIFCNALLVGAMLSFVSFPAEAFWSGFAIFALEVAAGEAAVLYFLGLPLYCFFEKTQLIARLLGGAAQSDCKARGNVIR